MPLAPRTQDLPKIPGALRFYQVMAFVTGIFLLLLCLEILVRYGFGYDVEMGGPFGFLALVPHNQVTALNLSTTVLVVHGWLYVIYLISDFRLWSLMRWPFTRFIIIALGGVIPVLSFILEAVYAKRVKAFIAENPATRDTSARAAA
jgi:integral membrane protein